MRANLVATVLALTVGAVGTPALAKETRMTNKDVARHYLETVWDRGDLAAIDQLVAESYRGQTRAAGQSVAEGRAGLRKWVGGLRAAFPDGRKQIEALVAEGDQVVAQIHFRGTHAASGRTVENDQLVLLRLEGGRIVSESVFFDVGGTMKQLQP